MTIKLIRNFAIFLVSFLCLAFVFNKVSGITIDDVPPRYNLGATYPEIRVVAGDVYAVAPDGLTQERLCSMKLREEIVRREKINAVYSNSIADTLPILERLWNVFSFGDTDAGVAGGQTVVFVGEFTQLGFAAPVETSERCERQMVRRLNARHTLCLVKTSLTPEIAPAFSAFSFYPDQIWLPDAVFEKYELEKSEAAQKVQTLKCPTSGGVPWDIALRKVLNLVVEKGRPASPPPDLVPAEGA